MSEHKIVDISKEPGVTDLPLSVRGQFALAIKAEREGDNEKAATHMKKAVVNEDKLAK